jgi:hypothetical protein
MRALVNPSSSILDVLAPHAFSPHESVFERVSKESA